MVTNGVSQGEYKRFAYTPSGVSPRVLPGTEGTAYVAASDEHDETGVLISDEFTNPEIRVQMMDKRMRKMEGLLQDCPPPQLFGPAEADVTLIGWGSTMGVIREAMTALAEEGMRPITRRISTWCRSTKPVQAFCRRVGAPLWWRITTPANWHANSG
jgi:2-oxoglutarate ferredoxin oxidoreductase subunit alpha